MIHVHEILFKRGLNLVGQCEVQGDQNANTAFVETQVHSRNLY